MNTVCGYKYQYTLFSQGGTIAFKENGTCTSVPSINDDMILLPTPNNEKFDLRIDIFACGGCEGSYNATGWYATQTITQSISNGATIGAMPILQSYYHSNLSCPLFTC